MTLTAEQVPDALRRLHTALVSALLDHFESRAKDGRPIGAVFLHVTLSLLKFEGIKAPRNPADAQAALAKLRLALPGQEDPFKH